MRRLWLRQTGSLSEPRTRPCSQCGRGNADTAETGSRTSSPRISIDVTFLPTGSISVWPAQRGAIRVACPAGALFTLLPTPLPARFAPDDGGAIGERARLR